MTSYPRGLDHDAFFQINSVLLLYTRCFLDCPFMDEAQGGLDLGLASPLSGTALPVMPFETIPHLFLLLKSNI